MSKIRKIIGLFCVAFILIVVAGAYGCGPAPEPSLTTEDDEPVDMDMPAQMPAPEPSVTTEEDDPEEDDAEESPNDSTDSSEPTTPSPIGE